MKIALLSNKGGVSKTTTTVHFAAYLSKSAPTLAIDGDTTRSLIHWSERGELPFKVVSEKQSPKYWSDYQHCVVDTGARPSDADIRDLADVTDELIVVTACGTLSLDVLMPTVETLRRLNVQRFRILLSLVPPVGYAGREAQETIRDAGLPVFEHYIRRYACYERAAMKGGVVTDVVDDYAAAAWSDIRAVVKEMMG